MPAAASSGWSPSGRFLAFKSGCAPVNNNPLPVQIIIVDVERGQPLAKLEPDVSDFAEIWPHGWLNETDLLYHKHVDDPLLEYSVDRYFVHNTSTQEERQLTDFPSPAEPGQYASCGRIVPLDTACTAVGIDIIEIDHAC